MRARPLGIILLLTGPLLAGVGALLARDTPATYVQVDELDARHAELVGHPLAVHGIVASPRSSDGHWQFKLFGPDSAIAVDYRGIVPSTFVENAEVVVKGRLTPDDGLAADSVLVKVPD